MSLILFLYILKKIAHAPAVISHTAVAHGPVLAHGPALGLGHGALGIGHGAFPYGGSYNIKIIFVFQIF